MLIKNDFLNHWKTKLLCRRLGDGAALRALLSLWCYCEQRRAWQFKLSPLELAGVCDFAPEQEEHLSNGEFTQRVGDLYLTLVELRLIIPLENGWWEVNGWGELNASIIKKWPGRTLQTGEFYHPQGFVSRAIPAPIGQPIPPANDAAIAGAIGLDRIGLDRNPPLTPPVEQTEPPAATSGQPDPSASAQVHAPGKKKKGGCVSPDTAEMPDTWTQAKVQTMREWLRYKAERGQGYTPSGFAVLLRRVESVPDDALRVAVEMAMVNMWAGLFLDRVAQPAWAPQKKVERAAAVAFPSATKVEAPAEVPGWRGMEFVPSIYRSRQWSELPPDLWAEIVAQASTGGAES